METGSPKREDPPRVEPPISQPQPQPQRISSERLFAGAREIHIEHRGAVYRLQQTSLGKLILTK